MIQVDKARDKLRIALFLSSMRGGGVERLMVNLARGFAENALDVEFVLARAQGLFLMEVPRTCSVMDLGVVWGSGDKRIVLSTFRLVRYLSRRKPDVLIAAPGYAGVVALFAKRLARTPTRVFVIVDMAFSQFLSGRWHERLLVYLARHWYQRADAVVAAYPRAAKELIELCRIPAERVRPIYNPVITSDVLEAATTPPDHPWFQSGDAPIVLGVGRLVREKDFSLLIRAFDVIRKKHPAKLVIVGEGEERPRLEALIDKLRLSEDVSLPGFTRNPYSYIARASVLVLPSRQEALGGVLVEAMALGIPVVATNTPSGGPAAILEGGNYGRMADVGDVEGLAAAIYDTLRDPPDSGLLQERSRAFRLENVMASYLELVLPAIHR